MASKPQIKITMSDIESQRVTEVAEQLQYAKDIPLVRTVGSSSGNKDGFVTIVALVVAGLLGGLLTWGTWQILPDASDSFTANMQASFTLTLAIAAVLVLADGALSRSAAKLGLSAAISIPSAIALSFLLGLLANAIYTALVDRTISDLQTLGLDDNSLMETFYARNHLNRGLAWSILGLAAGLSVGVASKSPKRIAITGAGGLVGGFIGGFVFDYITGDGSIAQATGLLITGAAVGLSVSLLEQVTKSSWIEITRGGMAGKQFILYQNVVTIGSSPNANITLIKDPAILPIAATIKRVGTSVVIYAADRSMPVAVDGLAGFERKLEEGSTIVLGSTELRFREKAKKVNDSRIVRG
jgi:hypothetical protein